MVVLVALWALLGSSILLPTAPVNAQAPTQEIPRLQEQITDLTQGQVLAGEHEKIDAALTSLRDDRNIQLFVLFVESTGTQTVTEYADEVARRNSLGGNDALLLVALADRSDALWRGSLLRDRLTDRELGEVLSERVEPLLASGDFADAVVAGANGLADADSGSGQSSGLGGIASLLPILAIVLIIIGGLWLWNTISTRRRQRKAAEAYAQQTQQLELQASTLLIEADEALRTAEEEIRFAELQFGEAEIVPYRDAVALASKELGDAFTLRQELDDDVPETPDVQRKMVEQMLEHAQRARAALDEQRQRIEQLREVERRAPEILAGLPALLDGLEARIPEAERTLSSLERYAEASRASVMQNVAAAQEYLASARAARAEGQAALEEGDQFAAGRSARLAQQAHVEAVDLLDAVDSLAQTLRQAEQDAGPQIDAASADVQAARGALAEREVAGRRSPDLDRRLAEAADSLARARRELTAEQPDFLAASRLATHADAIADQLLADVREEEERRERAIRILDAQLRSADASYARAAHYIRGRHRGMGSVARTRLAEARRHLDRAHALAADDPQAALVEARRAEDRAEAAYAIARQDFDGFGGYGGRGGGVFPIPFPIHTGGGWGGGGSGWGGGGSVGGGFGGGGGGSVGGRW